MLRTFTLSNGIKVATYNLSKLKSVYLQTVVKAGSIFETPEINGAAHFMEHMIVQGIPTYPNVEQFSSFIEGLAGTYGAQTETMLITFHITLPFTYLQTAVKISSEVIFEPLFVHSAIEKERRAVINEILQRMDSHYYKISRFYKQSRYIKNNPLLLDTGGDLKVVKKLTRDDLCNYWKKYFVPANTYLLVVGSFKETVLKNYLEKYFASQPSNKKISDFPALTNSDYAVRQVAIREDLKLQTCYIEFNFPSLSLKDNQRDLLKQTVLLVILGRLRNSRLFKLLRYQKGLVYNVSASSSAVWGMGSVGISSETSKENLEEVIQLITQELSVFVNIGPTQEELDFAKNFLTNQWLMAFDHPSSIADWLSYDLLWREEIKLPEEYAKELATIKLEELIALMKEKWDFKKLLLVIQGPVENSKENIQNFEEVLKIL